MTVLFYVHMSDQESVYVRFKNYYRIKQTLYGWFAHLWCWGGGGQMMEKIGIGMGK